jgi:hypothetical protein
MIDNGKRASRPGDDFEISLEKDVIYDEESRRWFFYDADGDRVGPYDNELQAATALFRYSLEISAPPREDE